MGSLQDMIKEQGELVRKLKSIKADPAKVSYNFTYEEVINASYITKLMAI